MKMDPDPLQVDGVAVDHGWMARQLFSLGGLRKGNEKEGGDEGTFHLKTVTGQPVDWSPLLPDKIIAHTQSAACSKALSHGTSCQSQ